MLAETILEIARGTGYDCILLDTLNDMEAARALYQELGFDVIPPYYYNPIAGTHYLKAKLQKQKTPTRRSDRRSGLVALSKN